MIPVKLSRTLWDLPRYKKAFPYPPFLVCRKIGFWDFLLIVVKTALSIQGAWFN